LSAFEKFSHRTDLKPQASARFVPRRIEAFTDLIDLLGSNTERSPTIPQSRAAASAPRTQYR